MYTDYTKTRVRYSETDRMGYVYYGNYAQYFEVARVEALRSLGVSYKSMEMEGVLLPVLDFSIKYFKPAYYDDVLEIKTTITELPTSRIKFEYQTFNSDKELLNEGKTTLVFIAASTRKSCRPPKEIVDKLRPFFED